MSMCTWVCYLQRLEKSGLEAKVSGDCEVPRVGDGN